jgi:hypothetical protein
MAWQVILEGLYHLHFICQGPSTNYSRTTAGDKSFFQPYFRDTNGVNRTGPQTCHFYKLGVTLH